MRTRYIKLILLIVPALLYAGKVFSQDPLTNMNKYWHYRYRLVNHFMVVGPNAGESLPAGIRNAGDPNVPSNGPDALHYGDAPVYLGNYIGVLATEYACLTRNNGDVNRTLTELYYALNAVNRLDRGAEATFGVHVTNPLNGYMNMTDIPSNFIVTDPYAPAMNQNLPPSPQGGDVVPVQVCIGFDPAHPQNSEPSQDHLEGLLVGLALVKALVPAGPQTFHNYILDQRNATTNSQTTEDLNSDAVEIAKRIIQYMRYSPFFTLNDTWILCDPNGHAVPNGSDSHEYSRGLVLAGIFITGVDYSNARSVADVPDWASLPEACKLQYSASGHNISTLTLPLKIAAVGSGWDGNPSNTASSIQNIGAFLDMTDNTSGGYSGQSGYPTYYGMLDRVLHGGGFYSDANTLLDPCDAVSMLNSAPYSGPYCHSSTDYAGGGWGSSDRFYDDPFYQDHGNTAFPGVYTGLDYMLLHNLYYLCQSAAPISSTVITGTYPQYNSPNVIGSTSTPYAPLFPHNTGLLVDYLYVKNALTLSNGGTYSGDVNLTVAADQLQYSGSPPTSFSGASIVIQNTTVEQGAMFKASVLPYTGCLPLQEEYVLGFNQWERINPHATNPRTAYAPTEEFKSMVPDNYSITSYPNPTTAQTTFSFDVENTCVCSLEIMDLTGKKIATVFTGKTFEAGHYTVPFDFSDLKEGMYLYSFTKGNQCLTRKIVKQGN